MRWCIATVALAVAVSVVPAARAGTFVVSCTLGPRMYDDPIVFPGTPGASHQHDFYGSRAANAAATYASMQAGRSTCSDHRDTAGYWHPTLYVGATPTRATLRAWYTRGGKPTVQPYPRQLKMVAGDSRATAAQSTSIAWWQCERASDHHPLGSPSARPPRCGAGQHLTGSIRFPDCWNGWALDSADHRSHVARSRHGKCPAGFPVPLPQLTVEVDWPVTPQPRDVALSSGAPFTLHADFWNTWHQARLRQLTHQCLEANIACGVVR